VLPYKRLIAGDEAVCKELVSRVKSECKEGVLLKVIIETGELKEAALIQRASQLAIEAGADFIKTSTGKVFAKRAHTHTHTHTHTHAHTHTMCHIHKDFVFTLHVKRCVHTDTHGI